MLIMKSNCHISKVDKAFIENMEDLLNLYSLPYNKEEPVLCFDEKSKELHTGSRKAIPCTPEGNVRKIDYEYIRKGTANIFMTVEPKGLYRNTSVTKRRTRKDFAEEIKRLTALPEYREAKKIHIVLDNLNTHNEKSLLLSLGKEESKEIMKRIQFHHTPKHASWLNMAEIELSVMQGMCTKKRIGSIYLLKKELATWQTKRNDRKEGITWSFTIEDAKKLFSKKGQN